jgi:hypothetical protein
MKKKTKNNRTKKEDYIKFFNMMQKVKKEKGELTREEYIKLLIGTSKKLERINKSRYDSVILDDSHKLLEKIQILLTYYLD